MPGYGRRPTTRSIRPKDFPLGRQLHVSQSNPYGCPVCVRSTKVGAYTIEIFVNGVRFSCGCIVDLPPMHDGRTVTCSKCHEYGLIPLDFVDLDRVQRRAA
jgi:hypothetical protein